MSVASACLACVTCAALNAPFGPAPPHHDPQQPTPSTLHTQVLLRGGDLLLLHSDAREVWRHGIAKVTQEHFHGGVPPLHIPLPGKSPYCCTVAAAAGDNGVAAAAGDDSVSAPLGCDGLHDISSAAASGLPISSTSIATAAPDASACAAEAAVAASACAAGGGASKRGRDDDCVGAQHPLLVVRGVRLSVTLRRLKSGLVLTEQA
eukprot:158278-Chlamydomonas_euryale.AAC.5